MRGTSEFVTFPLAKKYIFSARNAGIVLMVSQNNILGRSRKLMEEYTLGKTSEGEGIAELDTYCSIRCAPAGLRLIYILTIFAEKGRAR